MQDLPAARNRRALFQGPHPRRTRWPVIVLLKIVASLLLAGCRSHPDHPESRKNTPEGPSPVVSVETTGRGTDMSEARRAAILAGMRQVAGNSSTLERFCSMMN